MATLVLLIAVHMPAKASPVTLGEFQQFAFSSAGTGATGCDPADPDSPFCIPSGGTPSSFLGAAPWTFAAPAGATLQVTDAFNSGDRFQIFDFGVSLGLTSAPANGVNCGDDPAVCLATPGMRSTANGAALSASKSGHPPWRPILAFANGGPNISGCLPAPRPRWH